MSAGSIRAMPSLRFRRLRAVALLVTLASVVTIGVHLIGHGQDATPTGSQQPPSRTDSAPAAPTSASATALLTGAADARNSDLAGGLSVGVVDVGTGVSAAYDPDAQFTTASIVKVDILATLLLQRNGKLSGSERALGRRMIQQSDNGAASVLWRRIGRAAGLDEANRRFGLTSTVAGSGGTWGTTTTTAADQLRLLTAIFTDGSPLEEDSRAYVVSLMGSVASDQDWGVSAADTRLGAKFHVKNGWLPRSGGWVVNSIGLVEHQGHRLLMVALSDGRPSKSSGIEVIERVCQDAAVAATGA